MTSAQTTLTPEARASRTSTARNVAAAAAALFAVALFLTVATVNVPHEPGDAELLQWWQQQSNRTSGVVSGVAAICVAVFFAVVANYLSQLSRTDRTPQW